MKVAPAESMVVAVHGRLGKTVGGGATEMYSPVLKSEWQKKKKRVNGISQRHGGAVTAKGRGWSSET